MSNHNIISAIDIGTNSIKALVGRRGNGSENIEILAKEEIPNFVGVRRGEIYDPKAVAEAILKIKDEIHKSEGLTIKKAFVNISGPHLSGLKSQGLVSVSRADQKISEEDVKRVFQASKTVNLPSNKEIIETFPQEFLVNGEGGIKNPVGLEGMRLEAKVLLLCVFSPVVENLEKSFFEAGISIEEIIPSFIASSRAVLSSEQKELGVAVIDIGAGATSLSIFQEGALKDFSIFPLGSANITNDIAIGLRTEINTAETIKREFGSFGKPPKKSAKREKEKIIIPEKEISVSRKFLENIIKVRVSEIFFEIEKILNKASKEMSLPGGIVFTGGGSLLPGLIGFAREKFGLPCYLSGSKSISGLDDPAFSTVAGLLLCGLEGRIGQGARKEGAGNIFKKLFRIFLP